MTHDEIEDALADTKALAEEAEAALRDAYEAADPNADEWHEDLIPLPAKKKPK